MHCTAPVVLGNALDLVSTIATRPFGLETSFESSPDPAAADDDDDDSAYYSFGVARQLYVASDNLSSHSADVVGQCESVADSGSVERRGVQVPLRWFKGAQMEGWSVDLCLGIRCVDNGRRKIVQDLQAQERLERG